MAENEAMEGKDLAIKEKQEFESKVLEAIKDLKTGETTISIEGIEVTNYGQQYTIKLRGITFGIIGKDGKFTYNKENFAQAKKVLEEEGITLEELGLPDIEEWIDEQEKQTEEKQTEENEKDEEDLSKEKEQEDPEKEETKDEAKEEIARRYRVSPNQVVHISLNERTKRVTDKYDMSGLTKWGEKYNDIFTLPGDDEYSWQTIGVDKDGNEEEIEMRQLEGKNPNVTIKVEDENSQNKEYKEVRPLAIYEIDSHSSYAIIRDSSGKTQALYCRQEEGRGKEYWGRVIPEAEGKNVKEASVESREAISHEHYSNNDLATRGKAYEKAKSLEKRGFPSKEGKGVQLKEVQGTPEQNRENYIEAIVGKLAEKAVASSSMPMAKTAYIKIHEKELRQKAERILIMGEEDSDITYDEAIDKEAELSKAEKEEMEKKYEGQKIRGQKTETH